MLGLAIHRRAQAGAGAAFIYLGMKSCRLEDEGVRALVKGLLGSDGVPGFQEEEEKAMMQRARAEVAEARMSRIFSEGSSGRPIKQPALHLDLSENRIAAAGAAAVGMLLRGASPLGIRIGRLALTGNTNIRAGGMQHLSAGIAESRDLQELDLQSTGLEAAGVAHLLDALAKAWERASNKLHDSICTADACMREDLTAHNSASLGYSDGSGPVLAQTPLQPPLKSLNLNGNGIGQQGGLALLAFLRQYGSRHPLRALGLRNNDLGTTFMREFGTFLRQDDKCLVWVEFSKRDVAADAHALLGEDGTDDLALTLGVAPWSLACRMTVLHALGEAREDRGLHPVPVEACHLIFAFLCSPVVRSVAVD